MDIKSQLQSNKALLAAQSQQLMLPGLTPSQRISGQVSLKGELKSLEEQEAALNEYQKQLEQQQRQENAWTIIQREIEHSILFHPGFLSGSSQDIVANEFAASGLGTYEQGKQYYKSAIEGSEAYQIAKQGIESGKGYKTTYLTSGGISLQPSPTLIQIQEGITKITSEQLGQLKAGESKTLNIYVPKYFPGATVEFIDDTPTGKYTYTSKIEKVATEQEQIEINRKIEVDKWLTAIEEGSKEGEKIRLEAEKILDITRPSIFESSIKGLFGKALLTKAEVELLKREIGIKQFTIGRYEPYIYSGIGKEGVGKQGLISQKNYERDINAIEFGIKYILKTSSRAFGLEPIITPMTEEEHRKALLVTTFVGENIPTIEKKDYGVFQPQIYFGVRKEGVGKQGLIKKYIETGKKEPILTSLSKFGSAVYESSQYLGEAAIGASAAFIDIGSNLINFDIQETNRIRNKNAELQLYILENQDTLNSNIKAINTWNDKKISELTTPELITEYEEIKKISESDVIKKAEELSLRTTGAQYAFKLYGEGPRAFGWQAGVSLASMAPYYIPGYGTAIISVGGAGGLFDIKKGIETKDWNKIVSGGMSVAFAASMISSISKPKMTKITTIADLYSVPKIWGPLAIRLIPPSLAAYGSYQETGSYSMAAGAFTGTAIPLAYSTIKEYTKALPFIKEIKIDKEQFKDIKTQYDYALKRGFKYIDVYTNDGGIRIPVEPKYIKLVEKTGRITFVYAKYQFLFPSIAKALGLEYYPTPLYSGSDVHYVYSGFYNKEQIKISKTEALKEYNNILSNLIKQGYTENTAREILRYTKPDLYIMFGTRTAGTEAFQRITPGEKGTQKIRFEEVEFRKIPLAFKASVTSPISDFFKAEYEAKSQLPILDIGDIIYGRKEYIQTPTRIIERLAGEKGVLDIKNLPIQENDISSLMFNKDFINLAYKYPVYEKINLKGQLAASTEDIYAVQLKDPIWQRQNPELYKTIKDIIKYDLQDRYWYTNVERQIQNRPSTSQIGIEKIKTTEVRTKAYDEYGNLIGTRIAKITPFGVIVETVKSEEYPKEIDFENLQRYEKLYFTKQLENLKNIKTGKIEKSIASGIQSYASQQQGSIERTSSKIMKDLYKYTITTKTPTGQGGYELSTAGVVESDLFGGSIEVSKDIFLSEQQLWARELKESPVVFYEDILKENIKSFYPKIPEKIKSIKGTISKLGGKIRAVSIYDMYKEDLTKNNFEQDIKAITSKKLQFSNVPIVTPTITKVKSIPITKVSGTIIPLMSPVLAPILSPIIIPVVSTAVIPIITTISVPITPTIPTTAIIPTVVPILIPEPTIVPVPEITTEILTGIIPTPTPIKGWLFFSKKTKIEGKKEQGYDSFAFIDATKTSKAYWKKLNREALLRDTALGMSAQFVDENISARGKVKKSTLPISNEFKNDYYKMNSYKFRPFKVRKGKKYETPNEFIELSRYRLDKPGEVNKIREEKIRQMMISS